MPYLVECGYFKLVEFVFLVVGHTKNACHLLFNSLKREYPVSNIWTFNELFTLLGRSYKVEVKRTQRHLKDYYTKMVAKIKQNHLFIRSEDSISTTHAGVKKINITIKEADIPDAESCHHQIRRPKTSGILPNQLHPQLIVAEPKNAYKVVEFYDKWRHIIPPEIREEMCPKPMMNTRG